MGKSKPTYEADDKKLGLTLAELTRAVEKFNEEAQDMGVSASDSKISVLINFSGGIKSITAEV